MRRVWTVALTALLLASCETAGTGGEDVRSDVVKDVATDSSGADARVVEDAVSPVDVPVADDTPVWVDVPYLEDTPGPTDVPHPADVPEPADAVSPEDAPSPGPYGFTPAGARPGGLPL